MDFFKRFCQIWSTSAKVPEGRLPVPDPGEEKAIFYCGHRCRYRVRFERCGHGLWAKDINYVAKFMQTLFQEEVEAGLIVPATPEELKRCQLQSKADRQLAISDQQITDVASGRKMSAGPRKQERHSSKRDHKRGRNYCRRRD